ncbi:MAG: hypothetical protein ACFCVE_09365 [Phycisphaerae bacterium]
MRRLFLSLFVCLGAVSLVAAQALAEETALPDPFAGTWRISADPDAASSQAGQKPFKESLLFVGGRLSGEALSMYGFTPAEYTLGGEAGDVTFAATMRSEHRGRIVFVGRANPARLVGKLEWTKPDGQVHTYDFTGQPFTPDKE